ncbi:hypothetical protein RR48_03627 [Papilio machaon]|uniref:Uncharacterized protein n=1 Tax=Papilio machaon TaxID=76193 RepID=A0A0N1INP7_PAPMA|nr:hypothetical protein RR48_03627 [Papilio machaon]
MSSTHFHKEKTGNEHFDPKSLKSDLRPPCVVSLRRPPHLTQLTRTGIATDATRHKPSQHTASEKCARNHINWMRPIPF